MSLFGLSRSKERYGAIVDIGSGSVLIAIVHSEPGKPYPQIVWSHREHAPLRNIDSLEQSAKAVMTALMNTAIELDTKGRKALQEYNSHAALTELQCSISAPWSYTVTKTINYKQEQKFTVSHELIDQLMQSIKEKIDTDLGQNEALQELGLQVVARLTMDIKANGYHIPYPEGNKANALAVSQVNAITQQYLVDTITELKEKIFTRATVHKQTFIMLLYVIARELINAPQDCCLVDVTYEATEIGIVRDGILTYCTHTPFGSFSLAREISAITGVPLEEAFGYLHSEKPYSFLEKIGKKQRADVETAIEAYTGRLSDLFHETGDTLAIPKRILLHTDFKSEVLFMDLVEKAAKRSIKTEPFITNISEEVRNRAYSKSLDNSKSGQDAPNDTALLLSAQFFHIRPKRESFEYL